MTDLKPIIDEIRLRRAIEIYVREYAPDIILAHVQQATISALAEKRLRNLVEFLVKDSRFVEIFRKNRLFR